MHRFFFSVLLLATLAATPSAHAQSTWATVSSGTAQNLWGICYGGGQFVAVGEGGTVLTSPDGAAWTPHPIGAASWLLAVTYSAELQRYAIVGDQGLVLTSTDGVTWTARTSGTAQRLNGIAWGGGRFLAVGEAGATCTSTDGLTWTTHAITDAAGWLRGVVYGAGRFVVSGQAFAGPPSRLSVWTSTDGAQFGLDVAGNLPVTDLEALAFDGSAFAAAGHFVGISPASFPLNWTTRFIELSGLSTPPFHAFRGVTFFNNNWVAVGALTDGPPGAASPIVYGPSNIAGYQQATGVPATASLTAVAIDGTSTTARTAVAVGLAGTIVRASSIPTPPQPVLLSTNHTIIATVNSTVSLAADASGSAPLTYQWNFNGTPITGATQPTLTLTNLQPAQSGSYTLTAKNPFGTATSDPYFVTVTSPLTVTAPVDPNFVTPLTGKPVSLAVQPDGKILVAAPTSNVSVNGQPRIDLMRLNTDGSLDAAFHPIIGVGTTGIELLRDGRILLDGFRRLNPDGTVDPTFTGARLPFAHVVLDDGRFIGATLSSNTLTFSRFNADGTPDSSYAPAPIVLAPRSSGAFDPSFSQVFLTRAAQGNIMVAAASYQAAGTGIFSTNQSEILRLLPDGTPDPSFAMATVTGHGISQFVSVGDKFYFFSTSPQDMGFSRRYGVGRLNADGNIDPAYPIITLGGTIPVFPLIQIASDGSVYFATANTTALQRFTPDGKLDPEFSAQFSAPVTFSALRPIDGGRLLATGDFTQLNGTSASYLARLIPDTHASATRLTNLSVRQMAGTGNQTLIVGLVITGSGGKSLLLRGIGPTLATFHLANPLADPSLSVFDAKGAPLLSNDNWGDNANAANLATVSANAGAFPLPSGSKDAALLAPLSAGAFTMQIGLANGSSSGVALAEGYDTDAPPADYNAARVANFSARAVAGSNEATLIAGFTITGPNVKRVLIRAVGPSLAQFGVGGTLPNPVLRIYSGTTLVAINDDWNAAGNGNLRTTFTATGAFPLSESGKDAALLLTLPPGSYTAQVSDASGTATGTALVEVYEVR